MTRTLEVYEQVLTCERCKLCTVGNGPIPFRGPTDAEIVILGEAPGHEDDEAGTAWSGAAARKMHNLLMAVGIDPESCFWMNAVSCWADGHPSQRAIDICRPNKEAQLELVNPRWVLVLGEAALRSFRPERKIGDVRGRFLYLENVPGKPHAFVTYHPSAVLRNGKLEEQAIADLRFFKEAVDNGLDWTEYLKHQGCVACTSNDVCWIEDGLPTCEKHAPKTYEAARQRALDWHRERASA